MNDIEYIADRSALIQQEKKRVEDSKKTMFAFTPFA
jgi:hypothetical protein